MNPSLRLSRTRVLPVYHPEQNILEHEGRVWLGLSFQQALLFKSLGLGGILSRLIANQARAANWKRNQTLRKLPSNPSVY